MKRKHIKRTADEYFAKAIAFEECAEHLGMAWADNEIELIEGDMLANTFREQAKHWRKLGQQRLPSNVK